MSTPQPRYCPFLLSTFASFFLVITSLYAQPLNAVENYAINRPGVVMIKTVFSANVYVNKMRMDNRRFDQLLDSIQKLDTSGVVTSEQKLDIVLKEMNNNPGRFFKTTPDYIQQAEEITSTGTGFIITADGYVATNCHLIDRDNAYIRRKFILSAFQQITDANIIALQNSWATKFTDQQRNLMFDTYASVYSRLFSMIIYDLRKNVYVFFKKNNTDKDSVGEKVQASVIIKGQPMPGKDIAILKIYGDSALPTLKIAEPGLPRVGEQLFVYGYPSAVTNNDFVSAESAIEPTLSTGIVSAIKKSVGGWPVIQMDANIHHGSSGGPVCNEYGEVIGLTTFGSLETNGGLAAGLNFAIPISILNEYLDTTDLKPVVSKPSARFREAIHFFQQSMFKKALSRFEEVKKLNSDYPEIEQYIKDCQSAIKNGKDKNSLLNPEWLICISLLLFIGLIIFSVYQQWKRKEGLFSKSFQKK